MSSTKPTLCSGDAWHNLILSAATAQCRSLCLSNRDGFCLTSPRTRLNSGNTTVHTISSLWVLGVNWELSYIPKAHQVKKHRNACASYFCIVCLEFYTTAPDARVLQWFFPTMFPITVQRLSQFAWVRSMEARLGPRCE